MLKPPRKGELFELIELGAESAPERDKELAESLRECIRARGAAGTRYAYNWLNARTVEVRIHDTSGAELS